MAIQLTPREKEHFRDLENNFEKHVDAYRKEREFLGRHELQEELKRLEEYQMACMKGQADDILINIRFTSAKIIVLKKLLQGE